MSGVVDGRVVIVTGAGNGIGRAHALLFAQEGAKVVVNDLGGSRDGSGGSAGPAQQVVDEIRAAGGEAVANTDDISSWAGAERLVGQAVEAFGRLDVLVNNAGILRDRMLANMSEAEWDAVIQVHLKGTFAPTRIAAAYWRDQSKAGQQVDARVINTTSPSGLFGNVGQTNYGAAKAGIASFSVIAAQELARYGVTVNAIAPTALTRMTEDLMGLQTDDEKMKASLAPENISPLVVWLASPQAAGITGRVFGVWGNRISVAEGWVYGPTIDREERWMPGELSEVLPQLVAEAAPNADMMGARAAKVSYVGSLDGRVALVTGASRGIGAGIAGRLAAEGAAVAVSARTLEPDPRYVGTLQDTVDAIERVGGRAKAFQCDLARSDQRHALVQQVTEQLGPIDILVNNAAVTFFSPVQDFPLKRLDLMLEVQVRAPFELIQLVLPGMHERGRGWVLNISSRAAEHPEGPPYDPFHTMGSSVYGACKVFLERFTETLAAEGHGRGVRANTLAPFHNVATPGAGAHDLVEDYDIEPPTVMAEAALALVEGDLSGRIALSQSLLEELGRTPADLPEGLAVG